MNKIVLVDGNNLMFRSYFATAYTGNLMKNSKGQVTNALYGFANMINKILKEEEPSYMAVAFDIGKTFRHEEYDDYKAGRAKTPDELKSQMPLSRELLECMGIKHLELEGYCGLAKYNLMAAVYYNFKTNYIHIPKLNYYN